MFQPKSAYELSACLVGSGMFIRDRLKTPPRPCPPVPRRGRGGWQAGMTQEPLDDSRRQGPNTPGKAQPMALIHHYSRRRTNQRSHRKSLRVHIQTTR